MASINLYALSLSRLDRAFDEQTIRSSLAPFTQAIGHVKSVIDRAMIQNDEAYQDFLLDDDLNLIENHLGCAFITCQVFLTAAVSRVKALHELTRSQGRVPFKTSTESKRNILAAAAAPLAGTPYTQMQVIDAFANYFKHRDEWDPRWSKLDKQSAYTASVIRATWLQARLYRQPADGSDELGQRLIRRR